MTARDYAVEIEPGATPERLNHIEQVLRKAFADEDCRLAQLIDSAYLRERKPIILPSQAAELCREEAEKHRYYT
jgi:hypothetical protein